MILISFFISPVFATEINNPATCDSGTLSTDTGPTNLRANYESNTLNLKWHDENGTPITSNTCTYGGTITMPAAPTKKGYTFKGWKVITHTPVEYIRATGTQYVDTGINPVDYNDFKWEIDFKFAESYRLNYSGFGTSNSYMSGAAGIWIKFDIKNETTVGIQGNGNNTETKITTTPFQRHVYKLQSNGVCSVDGQTYSLNYVSLPYTTKPLPTIFLFKVNQPGYSSNASATATGGYLYRSRMWNGDVLIQDIIPVKDSDGVACMYDKVTKQYFYNAGTGDFIAGPDL